jgi:sugar diacid utilization regulator
MAALQRSFDIHSRLTDVATAGEGRDGIARALYELTGHAVAVEDRYGNLAAWAGQDRPAPYPKDVPMVRDRLLRKAFAAGRPIRHKGRLVAVARVGDEVRGVIAIIDPRSEAGEADEVALEHAATVLAVELSHRRTLVEVELRLRRDLVEELLSGADADSAIDWATALDYDLGRPHRVIVVEDGGTGREPDSLFHAVRRAARDLGVGSLLVARGGAIVLLAHDEPDWSRFHDVITAEHGNRSCRVGIGERCDRPEDFPRSFREAQLALQLQRSVAGSQRATVFDELGVYRMLAALPDSGEVEAFVRRWLGPLIDYDASRGSHLVETLSGYLESGGNYDAAAKRLALHRSTLRYRLQRLRELSGHDLSDPDTRFNLQLATRAVRTIDAVREAGH